MEQKKTLWIITAAGMFLAVVLLAAIMVNRPGASNVPATAAITTVDMMSNRPVAQKTEDTIAAVEPSINKEDLDNLSDAEKPEEGFEVTQLSPAVTQEEDGTVTIDLNQVASSEVQAVTPRNETAAIAMETKKQSEKADTIYTAAPSKKTAAEVEAEKQASWLNSTGAKPKEVAQTSGSQGSVKTAASTTASSGSVAAAATATVKPAYVETTKYWVQCAAYNSKKTADQARSTLDENRIPAEVFTYKDAKDNLFYRVRVGPYTTKSEAEYWKNRIGQIAAFKNAQSYITMN